MKRIIIFLVMCAFLVTPTLAEGDPNIGGGGGGMGSGSGSCYWNPGWDGVRVSVVDTNGTQVCTPIDLTNKAVPAQSFHFGKHNKIEYKNSLTITPNLSGYTSYNPVASLPKIINSSGGNNIEAIKSYFTDTGHLLAIAGYIGMSYDDLISGNYKLLIEPISYFTYHDIFYAMTATEAALFDVMTNHGLRYNMPSLTHQNLPLSMFLEKDDLEIGIAAWNSATTGFQSNLNIIKYLGVGVVSFKENEIVADPATEYIYHTDTDVMSSIAFTNTWGEIDPDNSAWLIFNINGVTYSKEFICPEGGRQMVWVRWHTPSTPQKITVTVTCAKIGLSTNIPCDIIELEEHEPPDPGFYDAPVTLTASVPDYGSNTTATWGEWFATWHANWVWVSVPVYDSASDTWYDAGDYEDQGWWDWQYVTYTANLEVDYELVPDSRVKTAFQNGDDWEMKSGYGVSAKCNVVVTSSAGASTYDTTDVQNVVAVFSDFNYETYDRLLEFTGLLHGYDLWEFKTNRYSYYNDRVHFTPLRYPDNTKYTVPLNVLDAWTPGGQLYSTVSDYITIFGDMYDDGYIRTLK